jgi:hypothetical protein
MFDVAGHCGNITITQFSITFFVSFSLLLKGQLLKLKTLYPTEKKSGVSGSFRSTKMYSCAQCAMQKRSMCCRDVPCLTHMEQGTGPLHPEHLPPSFSAWVLGTQSTSSPQQGWTWTVEWTLASSPTQNLWPSENVC